MKERSAVLAAALTTIAVFALGWMLRIQTFFGAIAVVLFLTLTAYYREAQP